MLPIQWVDSQLISHLMRQLQKLIRMEIYGSFRFNSTFQSVDTLQQEL